MSFRKILKKILAVDLGGTKVATAIITRDGQILKRKQEPTCQDGPKEGIKQIMRLLHEMVQENELRMEDFLCVGVGIPAVLEPETDIVVWAPNLKGWREVALRQSLEQELGIPVFIEYDGRTGGAGRVVGGRWTWLPVPGKCDHWHRHRGRDDPGWTAGAGQGPAGWRGWTVCPYDRARTTGTECPIAGVLGSAGCGAGVLKAGPIPDIPPPPTRFFLRLSKQSP